MTQSSYIILGAGASGLMLAYRMSQDRNFDDKSILIIDQVKDKGNDRTWCYWEEGEGEWDDLLSKKWSKVFFGSEDFTNTLDISPHTYKMIRSQKFYHKLWRSIEQKSNFIFVEDSVKKYSEVENGVKVVTNKSTYFGLKLLNSIPGKTVYEKQQKYPVLKQHFVGWFIKTKTDCFDDSMATFMDFNIPQNGNTRFMYVLPIDKKTALFEYTLFSKDLLENSEYEDAIKDYLKEKKVTDFEILEKENGAIPMTSFKFQELNSKSILNIGTAGGWTKASTGYTFYNTSKKTKDLVAFLKNEDDLSLFAKRTKFWFYDLLLLDVLANNNKKGSALFASIFKKVNVKTILKFLGEDSNIREDLKIITSVSPKPFVMAIVKRFLRIK
ncbi:MAG: lycopene cyclase [Crocinitomicaceae bacterium]|nr:lycopene cyclase [Crocinitomicaceae bacterium]